MLSELKALSRQRAPRRDALLLATTGLLVRLFVVACTAGKFPPTDDGHFYQVVAERIARGLGYTWLWPDGAVTYAAHYPVGYPALLGVFYRLFAASPTVAMVVNALLGAVAVYAVHRLSALSASRLGAFAAGLAVALNPGLVMYTPALMTEGASAALIALGAWSCARSASGGVRALVAAGVLLGISILVRPQLLLAVPLLGLLATPDGARWRERAARTAAVTVVAILVCLPWTARNCQRLESCVFVSANGGWNLFIGSAEQGRGGWVSLESIGVPDECKNVFGEAEKDHCFGRAGVQRIAAHPLAWLRLVPAKLRLTFDYSGAAAYYLHAANPQVFSDSDKNQLGVIETAYSRVVLLLALVGLARLPGSRPRARRVLGAVGVACSLLPLAWAAHLLLVLMVPLLGKDALRSPAVVAAAAVVATTALTHAVFFGAARYAVVTFTLMGAAVGLLWPLGWRAEGERGAEAAPRF